MQVGGESARRFYQCENGGLDWSGEFCPSRDYLRQFGTSRDWISGVYSGVCVRFSFIYAQNIGVRIPRNSAWVGCLVFAAPIWLGMIFGGWISTNRLPLWGWGQIARFRKISATPPRPSPSMGLMEREKEAVGSIGF